MDQRSKTRGWIALGLVIASVVVSWKQWILLGQLAWTQENYSYILVVPLISGWLLWTSRTKLAQSTDRLSSLVPLILVAAGILVYLASGRLVAAEPANQLAPRMLGIVIVWIGAFLWTFGLRAARVVMFPLLFLGFIVPLPHSLMQSMISELQRASAAVTYSIFQLLGVPVYRDGFVFTLPNLTIEVAQECSGVRSAISLLLMSLLLAHVLLRSKTGKAVLLLLLFPIAVIKNSMRIVTISLLSAYVNPRFMSGELHRTGGILFFILAMGLVLALIHLLRRIEKQYDAVRPLPVSQPSLKHSV